MHYACAGTSRKRSTEAAGNTRVEFCFRQLYGGNDFVKVAKRFVDFRTQSENLISSDGNISALHDATVR